MFSSSVRLADINDFINPESACIFEEKIIATDNNEVQIRNTFGGPAFSQVEKKNNKVKLTLDNCLACSGCITSAETVLVESHSMSVLLEDLQKTPRTFVVTLSPSVVSSFARKFQISLVESCARLVGFFKTQINASYVFDTTGAQDIALLEARQEFVEKFQNQQLPLLCSECPGWICYAEKELGKLLNPHVSTTKSPQQIMGTLIKQFWGEKLTAPNTSLYHLTIMPCFDKKLEASRKEFRKNEIERDCDMVLTPVELESFFEENNISFLDLPILDIDPWLGTTADGNTFVTARDTKGSGGYLENIFLYASQQLFGADATIIWKKLRNEDLEEVCLEVEGEIKLRFLKAYGFKNIQNLARKLKRNKCTYHYVEIMACPGGCTNGSALIRAEGGMLERRQYVRDVQNLLANRTFRLPEQNKSIEEFYTHNNINIGDGLAYELFHTTFTAAEEPTADKITTSQLNW